MKEEDQERVGPVITYPRLQGRPPQMIIGLFLKDMLYFNLQAVVVLIHPSVFPFIIDKVYQKIRQGEVFGGLVLNEMAAVVQTRLRNDSHPHPLRIVREFSVRHPVSMLVPRHSTKEMFDNLDCMAYYKKQVYQSRSAINKRHCKIDHIYINSISESVRENVYVQALIGSLFGLWLVCFVVEYFNIGKGTTRDRLVNGGTGNFRGLMKKSSFRITLSQEKTKPAKKFFDYIMKKKRK